jgi:hypothetical protein
MDPVTRLGSMTTLWRAYVRVSGRTPPFDAHIPIERRALSEQAFLDIVAHYYPHLEVVAVERRPRGMYAHTMTASPASPSPS